MKQFLTTACMILAIGGISTAQENETVKSETTVKKVTIKEGNTVIVKETQDEVKKKGRIMVEGDAKQDQSSQEAAVMKKKEVVTTKSQQLIDRENEARKAAIMKREKDELEQSKRELMEQQEARRREMEEKKAAQMKAMEERKAELMKRGKGVNKLKKKKGDGGL